MALNARSLSSVLAALGLAGAALWPLQAHALFEDDEARKALIDLRNRFDAHRQATESTLSRLQNESREGNASEQRSLLELANQNEQLRAEIARLRGQVEQLGQGVSELQKQQKAVQAGVDERLRKVEPATVNIDGREFAVVPEEKRDFDGAMALVRSAEFGPASASFTGFLKRYPSSGYLPSALYWLGNAHYANRSYKDAIASHRRLVAEFPDHVRTPEALLAMANSQIELKDTKAAERTLATLLKNHPNSEAAAAGRERLSRLR